MLNEICEILCFTNLPNSFLSHAAESTRFFHWEENIEHFLLFACVSTLSPQFLPTSTAFKFQNNKKVRDEASYFTLTSFIAHVCFFKRAHFSFAKSLFSLYFYFDVKRKLVRK